MPPFLCPEGMGGGAGSPAAQRGQKNVAPYGVTIPHPARPVFYGLPATRKPDGRRQKEGKAKPQTCTTFAAVKTKGAHFVRLLIESSSFLYLACCDGGNCVMTFLVKSCMAKNPDAAKFMFSSICSLL